MVYVWLVHVVRCYPKDYTITLLPATAGELGAVSRRDPLLLPCMDLGLLCSLALRFQDARLRGSGPLREGMAGAMTASWDDLMLKTTHLLSACLPLHEALEEDRTVPAFNWLTCLPRTQQP